MFDMFFIMFIFRKEGEEMLSYRLIQKTKVLAGRGMIARLPDLLTDAGFTKPCLVFDKGVEAAGIIKRITDILSRKGFSYHTYNKITADPVSDLVDEGAAIHKAGNCDCIVAIGGGSTMDAAKGINIMCHNDGHILDYAGNEDKMSPAGGLICIPTTSGTGSELSNWIVISDRETGAKHPINIINSMAEYALLDPELTVGLPPQITAATGMDVFCHAFEAYTSTQSSIATDLICEKIMETVIHYLPIAVDKGHDIVARERMMMASSYGGWMLVDGLVHIGHCIAHELGAAFHIPHGAACAYAFPAMVNHIALVESDKIRYVGELLGVTFTGTETYKEIAEKTTEAFLYFRDKLIKLRPFSDYNPDLTKVDLRMAQAILDDPITSLTPVPVTLEDVLYMLYTTVIS